MHSGQCGIAPLSDTSAGKGSATATKSQLERVRAEQSKLEAEQEEQIAAVRLAEAATRIQALHRGQTSRLLLKSRFGELLEVHKQRQREEEESLQKATRRIQGFLRGRSSRTIPLHEAAQLQRLREEERERQDAARQLAQERERELRREAALRIQAFCRGRWARRRRRERPGEPRGRAERGGEAAEPEPGPGALFEAIALRSARAAALAGRRDLPGLNARDPRGRTALHAAAERGLEAVCRALLASGRFRGAAARDERGWTALHLAARAGHAAACAALLAGEAARAPGRGGATALHCAATHGQAQACQILLDDSRFQDVNAVDRWGRTALHCAAEYEHARVCDMIASHSRFTGVEWKNKCGYTAWDVAVGEAKRLLDQLRWRTSKQQKQAQSAKSEKGDTSPPNTNPDRATKLATAEQVEQLDSEECGRCSDASVPSVPLQLVEQTSSTSMRLPGASLQEEVLASRSNESKVVCSQGHEMKKTLAWTEGGECDGCGREIQLDEEIAECQLCEDLWWLCLACASPSSHALPGRSRHSVAILKQFQELIPAAEQIQVRIQQGPLCSSMHSFE